MKRLLRWCRSIAYTTALGLFLAACTQTVSVPTVLESELLVESLPVTVGVYYSGEFRNASISQAENLAHGVTETAIYQLGEPSVELFDRVFGALFETTVEIQAWPGVSGVAPEVAAVIEPQIASFWASRSVPSNRFTARIIYEFKLYAPEGAMLGNWEASGSAETRGFFQYEFISRSRGEATALAMRAAAAEFASKFRTEPVVISWLERLKVGGS